MVVVPQAAQPMQLRDDVGDFGRVILAGYTPGEQVYLLTNTGETVFVTMNASGNGGVTLTSQTHYFRAIVPETGNNVELSSGIFVRHGAEDGGYAVPQDAAEDYVYDWIWGDIQVPLEQWTCPGGAPIRLVSNHNAQVIYPNVNYYSDNHFGSESLGSLSVGTRVVVISGVRCADQATWWQARINDEPVWVPESSYGVYFLAPA
jgi:hypothetical protein